MNDDRLPSRREFLKLGAAGLAGAAFLPPGAASAFPGERSEKIDEFTCRTLGRTGLKLPIVSMGSCYAIDLVRTALDEGIVYIHTSSGYFEKNHERMLGKVFRNRPRDSFVVATSPDLPYKFRRDGMSADLGRETDPKLIAKSVEDSLMRLGLDYVDIYYLASVGNRGTVLHEPYVEAYGKLKKAGKIRFAGIATHENEPAVIRAAAESGFWDVVLTAYNFRQTHRDEIRSAIRRATGEGVGIVAMKTMAGVYWDRAHTRKINMKAALKWALQDENVHTTIPAFSNFEEMREVLAVMKDPVMTPEERQGLGLGVELGFSGCYCQQCGRCLAQCPADMDIPTLMRASMYAFAYREPGRARDTLRSWTPGEIACGRCEKCSVQCALGLDVKTNAMDVARILSAPAEFLG